MKKYNLSITEEHYVKLASVGYNRNINIEQVIDRGLALIVMADRKLEGNRRLVIVDENDEIVNNFIVFPEEKK